MADYIRDLSIFKRIYPILTGRNIILNLLYLAENEYNISIKTSINVIISFLKAYNISIFK